MADLSVCLSPARSTPGLVRVSLAYCSNTPTSLTPLAATQFVFTVADHSRVVECVIGAIREGLPLEPEMITSDGGPVEELSELDTVLTVAMQGLDRDALSVQSGGPNQNPRGNIYSGTKVTEDNGNEKKRTVFTFP